MQTLFWPRCLKSPFQVAEKHMQCEVIGQPAQPAPAQVLKNLCSPIFVQWSSRPQRWMTAGKIGMRSSATCSGVIGRWGEVETCHQKVLGSSCHCDQAGLLNYAKLKLEARLTLDHACSAVESTVGGETPVMLAGMSCRQTK